MVDRENPEGGGERAWSRPGDGPYGQGGYGGYGQGDNPFEQMSSGGPDRPETRRQPSYDGGDDPRTGGWGPATGQWGPETGRQDRGWDGGWDDRRGGWDDGRGGMYGGMYGSGGGYGGNGPGGDWNGGGWGDRENEGVSTPVKIAIGVLAVVAVLVLAAIAYFLVGRSDDSNTTAEGEMVTVTSTAQATSAQSSASSAPPTSSSSKPTSRPSMPGGVVEQCGDSGETQHGRWGTGSGVTSCAFAGAVRQAYLDSGGSSYVSAYSPVTGTTYGMSCSGGAVVSCSGGNNAVVYIY